MRCQLEQRPPAWLHGDAGPARGTHGKQTPSGDRRQQAGPQQ
jgi:hypothetical protein